MIPDSGIACNPNRPSISHRQEMPLPYVSRGGLSWPTPSTPSPSTRRVRSAPIWAAAWAVSAIACCRGARPASTPWTRVTGCWTGSCAATSAWWSWSAPTPCTWSCPNPAIWWSSTPAGPARRASRRGRGLLDRAAHRHLGQTHYEAPREWIVEGVLPDEHHPEVLATVARELKDSGFEVEGPVASPIRGAKAGNLEYLMLLRPADS